MELDHVNGRRTDQDNNEIPHIPDYEKQNRVIEHPHGFKLNQIKK
jgi:hypothetical protein